MRVGDSNLELMISSFTRLKILIQELLARMLPRKIETLNLRVNLDHKVFLFQNKDY